MTENRVLNGRRILVVTETFPNQIQPWMLNTTVQAHLRGAEVFLAAGGRHGHSHYAVEDQYGLLQRTMYVKPFNLLGALSPLRYLGGRSQEFRKAARRGIVRAFCNAERPTPRAIAKRLALAVPLGLREIDLIHSHSMALAYEFLRIGRALHIPLVHTFHGLPPEGVAELAVQKQRLLYREAACFLVNTKFARQQLRDLGCPDEKIQVIPQGIDLTQFPFAPQSPPDGKPVRLLTVGRLHREKGHAFALRALARLGEHGLDYRYRIVGAGPEAASLRQDAARLGIAPRVSFLGELFGGALRREYREAHIFVFPSLRSLHGEWEETQGVALQEAQASGCIVIATRSGGIPECLDESHTWLVPDRDSEALANAVATVLKTPERWSEWQEAGRAWVQDRYSIEKIGDGLVDLYVRILEWWTSRGKER